MGEIIEQNVYAGKNPAKKCLKKGPQCFNGIALRKMWAKSVLYAKFKRIKSELSMG